jgi:hypothetical protein
MGDSWAAVDVADMKMPRSTSTAVKEAMRRIGSLLAVGDEK